MRKGKDRDSQAKGDKENLCMSKSWLAKEHAADSPIAIPKVWAVS